MVTLGFLADGGDGYPLENVVTNNAERVDRVDLVDAAIDEGEFTFADTGTEQDAFVEYLGEFHREQAYSEEETSVAEDERIQNLAYREDTVLVEETELVGIDSGARMGDLAA